MTRYEFRIYTEAGTQDSLLSTAVEPFLTHVRTQGLAEEAFFLRDVADGRPRLRVCVEAAPQIGPEGAALARALAESVRQNGTSLQTVLVLPRRPWLESSPFRGPAADALVAGFLSRATPLLLEGVTAVHNREDLRIALALDLMIAQLPGVSFSRLDPGRYTASSPVEGLPMAFLSLRSHADGFFIMSRNPQQAREMMERRYGPHAERFEHRVRAILEQLDRGGEVVSEAADRWHRLVVPSMARAGSLIRSGELEFGESAAGGYLGDTQDISVSRFHQVVQEDKRFQKFMHTDSGFQSMRVMMSLLYLSLHCLGLRLVDRYFLCHGVSRACESVFGVDASDLLYRVTQRV